MADQQEIKRLTSNQKSLLHRRGLDPKDYSFVRETYVTLIVQNIHSGQLKFINKQN